jgi:predicted CopG family antitoxin
MVKRISLSNEAYSGLKAVKIKGESFSDLILRLLESNTKDIKRFAGILKNDAGELDWIEERIAEDRRKNNGRYQ